MYVSCGGWGIAALCLVAVFVPWFLLVIGALPFWEAIRSKASAQSALRGVLVAALYNPVWMPGITSAKDFALAIAAFLLLYMWQTTPWLVVILSAGGASLLALLPSSIF
jgi:chromate transporter